MKHLYLDWSAYEDAGMGDAYADIPKHGGSYAKAIAVCINSRQCEADGKQVMCPSYKVTGNEDLSTGGRVRLLKVALSSDSEEAFFEPRLMRAMEECVACKGCKRECEASVDMPLIKAEYLAQKRARYGIGLRGRLFAGTPRWLHYARWLRFLVATRNRLGWLAKLTERLLGINANVVLPCPAPRPFRMESTGANLPSDAEATGGQPEVALFVDTFNRYFEPRVAEAAVKVLRAAGYSVVEVTPASASARPICCGRTYLAQGMIDEARREARRLIESLLPHVRQGRTIVGLEASCILGLRDDTRALGLGDDVIEVSNRVLLFEEFLAREARAGRLKLPLKPGPSGTTLVHGHCHQKAAGAIKSMRHVLRLVEDHQFEFVDSTCCGMAGTFGIEAEHAAISRAMAEYQLLRALQESPHARVISNGFSCRRQIRAYAEHEAPQHLAELLSELMDSAQTRGGATSGSTDAEPMTAG